MSGKQKKFYNAFRNNNHHLVEELLKGGIDINDKNPNDCYPALNIAANKGDVKMVELLLEYGADVNIKDLEGYTSLMRASKGGHIDVMRPLIRYQADINKSTDWGMSALHWAAMNNKVQAVELLLQRGAHVNLPNLTGYTALRFSAEKGHTESVLILLKYGASVTLKNKDGKTALMLAESEGHTTTAEAIRGFIKPRKTVSTQTQPQAVPDLPLSPLTSSGLPEGYTHIGNNVFGNSSRSQMLVTQQLLPTNDNQAAAVVGIPYKRIDDPNQIVPLPNNLFMRDSHFSHFAPTQGKPTEKELSRLAGLIGFEWIQMALELEIPYSVAQQIKMEIPHDSKQQILDMLMRWRDSVQEIDEEDRCRILRRVLTTNGKKDLADTLI